MENNYVPPNQYQASSDSRKSTTELKEKILNLQQALKSKPKHVCCPFCYKQGMTKANTECSILAISLCCIGGLFIPMIVQCIRGKDCNCNNAEHYCEGCGNKLADYKAC